MGSRWILLGEGFGCQRHGGVDQFVELPPFDLDLGLDFLEPLDVSGGFGEALHLLVLFFVGDHGRVFQ